MNDIKFTELSSPKSALALFAKAILGKKTGSKEIPKVGVKGRLGVIQKIDALQFMHICDYDTTSEEVPAVYLHIRGHLYHLELLTREDFPYKLLGTVHVSSKIKKYDSIRFGDDLDIELYFGESQPHEKGLLITLIQKLYRNGTLVWEEEMVFLRSQKTTASSSKKEKKVGSEPLSAQGEIWKLSSDLGRRYGNISGDLNPIHLFALSAKLFGFKRHIIHGVWTMARAMASLEGHWPEERFEMYAAFKLPIFLPNTVQFNTKKEEGQWDFEVRDKSNIKPHMSGYLKTLN